jgi:hypothetical protein
MEKCGQLNTLLAWLPGKETLITIERDAGWNTQPAGRGKEEMDLFGSGSKLVLQQDPSLHKILTELLVLILLLHINFQPFITERNWYARDVITYNLRGEDRLTIDDCTLNTASFFNSESYTTKYTSHSEQRRTVLLSWINTHQESLKREARTFQSYLLSLSSWWRCR